MYANSFVSIIFITSLSTLFRTKRTGFQLASSLLRALTNILDCWRLGPLGIIHSQCGQRFA